MKGGLEDLGPNAGTLEADEQRLQRRRLVAVARVHAQDLVENLASFCFDGGRRHRGDEREEHSSSAPYHGGSERIIAHERRLTHRVGGVEWARPGRRGSRFGLL